MIRGCLDDFPVMDNEHIMTIELDPFASPIVTPCQGSYSTGQRKVKHVPRKLRGCYAYFRVKE